MMCAVASGGGIGRGGIGVVLSAGLLAALLSAGIVEAAEAAEAASAASRAKPVKSRPSQAPTGRKPAVVRPARGDAVARASGTSLAEAPDYLRRPAVLEYIDGLVADQNFDRGLLMRVFADARYSATAARLMGPSSSGNARRDWSVYRARFVEPVRLAAGYRFWEDNAALLERAEREFGVPAAIVVGILGVETVYGRNTGSFRVIDALTTLAFDYPNPQRDRSAFFREQLTDALLMARDRGADLAVLRGSYAGAIGMPQFMPGSILRYAIDYDGDGRIDLVDSVADVIGSVANYLAQHGWVRGIETHVALRLQEAGDAMQAARIDAMVQAGSVPSLSLADLAASGLQADAVPPAEALALIDLPVGADASGRPVVQYLAGTANFHAITRYNRSYFYAYSVIELGATIKALREAR